jgi:hypothetical protein
MQTKYTIAAVVLAAAVALTGAAEAGKIIKVIERDNGPSSNASHDIGDIFHNTDDKPVIHKVIDLDPPKPVIYRDIGLDFGDANAGGAGTPGTVNGGLTDYRDVAKLNIGLKLNCFVAGTPVEFPDDLVISNAGLIAVPAGTKIQWSVAVAGEYGFAVLAKTLTPGKSVKLNSVLEGGVELGSACAITAIGH